MGQTGGQETGASDTGDQLASASYVQDRLESRAPDADGLSIAGPRHPLLHLSEHWLTYYRLLIEKNNRANGLTRFHHFKTVIDFL